MTHFTHAASLGSIQAVSHLAHALYDPESWLFQYARDEIIKKVSGRERERGVTKNNSTDSGLDKSKSKDKKSEVGTDNDNTDTDSDNGDNSLLSTYQYVMKILWEEWAILDYHISLFFVSIFGEPHIDSIHVVPLIVSLDNTPAAAQARLKKWKYNASVPLFISLPGALGPVLTPLPHPLWSIAFDQETSHVALFSKKHTEYSKEIKKQLCLSSVNQTVCPSVRVSACDSSLSLLKYITDFSARPTQIMVSNLIIILSFYLQFDYHSYNLICNKNDLLEHDGIFCFHFLFLLTDPYILLVIYIDYINFAFI